MDSGSCDIIQPHPLTCIGSGDREHCNNILFIMLELIAKCLSDGGWSLPIDPDMLMFLHENTKLMQ